jgi:YVTN family beta-propeller protein
MKHGTTKTLRADCILLVVLFLFCAFALLPQPVRAQTVMATITVGSGPIGVAVTPNGANAYVANEFGNTVSVISTATNAVTAHSPTPTASPTPAIKSGSSPFPYILVILVVAVVFIGGVGFLVFRSRRSKRKAVATKEGSSANVASSPQTSGVLSSQAYSSKNALWVDTGVEKDIWGYLCSYSVKGWNCSLVLFGLPAFPKIRGGRSIFLLL